MKVDDMENLIKDICGRLQFYTERMKEESHYIKLLSDILKKHNDSMGVDRDD